MENNRQTKSNKKTSLVVLLLLIAIVAVILATYAWAKYAEKFDGEATASIAKWNVTQSTADAGFTETFEHVVDGKIAPGTSGQLSAGIDVTGTEVDVDYTITLLSVDPVGDGIVPENFVLKDENGTIIYKNKAIVAGTNGKLAEGTIAAGSTGEAAKGSKTFSWEWPYETGTDEEKEANNAQDTVDGKKAGSFKVTYKIDAVQTAPVAE